MSMLDLFGIPVIASDLVANLVRGAIGGCVIGYMLGKGDD